MGKSTVAKMLKTMGVPVHSSDQAVHHLMQPGGRAVEKVRLFFPQAYSEKTRSIDRKKLGQIVFQSKDARLLLEDILHPLVRDTQKTFLRRYRHHKIVVLDIPLLFETGAQNRVDAVIVVSAPYFIQKQRVLKRPGMTLERFYQVLALQIPDKVKRGLSDVIIPTGLGRAVTRSHLQKMLFRAKLGYDPRNRS